LDTSEPTTRKRKKAYQAVSSTLYPESMDRLGEKERKMTVLERSTTTGFDPKRLGKILGSAALVGAVAVGTVFAINNVAVEETPTVANSADIAAAHPKRTSQRNTFAQRTAASAVVGASAVVADDPVSLADKIEGYPSVHESRGSLSKNGQFTYGGWTAK
jgi:hypothetical protein